MLKRLILATAAIGALVVSATAVHPRFAHADSSCFLGTPLCTYTFGASTPVTCPLGTVNVTATADSHEYRYDVQCSNGYQGYSVKAAYNVNNHNASERLAGAGFSLAATWTCGNDPWSTPNAPQCLNIAAEAQPGFGAFGFVTGSTGSPFSTQNLSAQSLHVLAAQLQNALNQQQQPPAPQPAINLPAAVNVRGTTSVNPSDFLPKADLVAVGISGPASVFGGMDQAYTATVRNDGADVNGGVEVEIAFFPGFQNLDGAAVSAPGFDCSTFTAYTLDCRGGSLAQGQSVDITFRAYAALSGDAKLLMSVNPGQTVAESNTDNNTAVLDVSIQ